MPKKKIKKKAKKKKTKKKAVKKVASKMQPPKPYKRPPPELKQIFAINACHIPHDMQDVCLSIPWMVP